MKPTEEINEIREQVEDYINKCPIDNNELNKDFIKETDKIRLLTQTELEACMTVPAGYTKMLTYKEAANVLGDGWTINVITKFFENIK